MYSDAKRKTNLSTESIKKHIVTVEKLTLPASASNANRIKFKDSIKTIKEEETKTIIDVIVSASLRLTENADRTHAARMLLACQEQTTTDRTKTNDYFIVDPKTGTTHLKVTVIKALKSIESDLSLKRNYEMIPTTDRLLGIGADTTNLGEMRCTSHVVKNKTKDGCIKSYSLSLHAYIVGGQRPDFLRLFRVPGSSFRASSSYTNEFTQKHIQVLNTCRAIAPVYESEIRKRIAKKFLRTIVGGIRPKAQR